MDDPFLKTLDEIRKGADQSGLRIFYGYMAEESKVPSVHWNRENGGDWKQFLACARTVGANVLYVNSAPFEQFQVDDAISVLESKLADGAKEEEETKRLVSQVRTFQPKVGLTCIIDLAFVANGVVHIYQETADWFDEFNDSVAEEEEENEEIENRKPVSQAIIDKWATSLASDPKYTTSKDRDYLLEKLAGKELSELPAYRILRRAEAIYETDFKQAAEEKLAREIKQLRDKGLNQSAIAIRLGIPKDRVSGLLSAYLNQKEDM